ncbi:BRCT domain-containing protein [Pseudovibrio ascidiaceicola]|uniref:BRCT domain-containing protein n=1 Tax=Pseudovibrio ascidiaceicola TaxID=285279 RepID=UPI000D694627|nr:BRCT domain-containing protein [Pseudovibrio ascidiaceicola]
MGIVITRENSVSRNRLDDRQVTELIGISRGLLADNQLSDEEIRFLRKWLAASEGVVKNPLVANLYLRLNDVLADGVVDDDERKDLFSTLSALTANDFEEGEVLKSTTLPLCSPLPDVVFDGNRFTFTGTFACAKRKKCEEVTKSLGASVGGIAQKTRFLVIGEYATDSWIHSSFGRKIEQAVEWRDTGFPISIISEQHWISALGRHMEVVDFT